MIMEIDHNQLICFIGIRNKILISPSLTYCTQLHASHRQGLHISLCKTKIKEYDNDYKLMNESVWQTCLCYDALVIIIDQTKQSDGAD